MSELFENLLWLPRAPDNIKSMISQVSSIDDLIRISKFFLNSNQLEKVARKLESIRSVEKVAQLLNFKLGIVSNSTTKLYAQSIIATGIRFGFNIEVIQADYNQVAQEAFSSTSSFENQTLDAVLVAVDYRGLPLILSPGNLEDAHRTVEECFHYIRSVSSKISEKSSCPIILQNIVPPSEGLLGSFDSQLPGTSTWIVERVNWKLNELSSANILIFDISKLASNLGLSEWHDPKLWNVGKIPFALKYIPIFSDQLCRLISARRGKSRRCLILDLDNTVWGGIIGDDGIDGILVGNGDPTGEAHLMVQQTALQLRDCGIVLAISSKNDDKVARRVFREHPDMLLREEHIAVFQANWSDKASNIRAIAKSLSLGLDSMVFLDDNPAERMQVRNELPQVAVPELPVDPAYFAKTLLAAGYFETIAFSDEDRFRSKMYQQNAKRATLLSVASDMESYLKSLQMEIYFSSFDKTNLPRISQLINKSNQFNLTTKRYSEMDISGMLQDSNLFTLQVRLTDTLGDNGMISVIICKKNSKTWVIDTWLMSCRVLGRKVEEAVLQKIINAAKESGADRLLGIFVPSDRNEMVREHYLKLGFSKLEDEFDEKWELTLTGANREILPMRIIDAF